MRTIWKYELKNTMVQDLNLPLGAQILSAQIQYGKLVLWAAVDNAIKNQVRRIRIYLTGDDVPDNVKLKYISTLQVGGIVIHIFEENPSAFAMKNLEV